MKKSAALAAACLAGLANPSLAIAISARDKSVLNRTNAALQVAKALHLKGDPAAALSGLFDMSPGGEEAMLKELEGVMMRAEDDPDSLGGVAAVVKPLIETLFKKVDEASKADKNSLDTSINEFSKCKPPSVADIEESNKGASEIETGLAEVKAAADKCKAEVAPLKAAKDNCVATLNTNSFAHDTKCQNLDAKPGPTSHGNWCEVAPSDNIGMWLDRMALLWQTKADELEKKINDCAEEAPAMEQKKAECEQDDTKFEAINEKCTPDRVAYERTVCGLKQTLDRGCGGYDGCYDKADNALQGLVKNVETQVASRKATFRMLKRLQCLVDAFDFDTGKVKKAALDMCANTDRHNTDHLDIKFPLAPAEQPCESKRMPQSIDEETVAKCSSEA